MPPFWMPVRIESAVERAVKTPTPCPGWRQDSLTSGQVLFPAWAGRIPSSH